MGWKIGDKPTVDPTDSDYVLIEQGGNTRNTTFAKLKKFLFGTAALTTTDKTVNGAINEVKATADANTTSLSELAKPNLLINSYFRNPINQRAKASYTTNGYTIDRWYMNAENGSLTVNDGYITLTSNATTSNTLLTQKFDTDFGKLNGSKLTCTIKYKTTTLDKFRIALCGTDTYVNASSDWTEKKFTIDISSFVYSLGTSQLMIQCYNGSNAVTGSISMQYIKLELGSIETPFVPKLYGEELALCKRYYEPIMYNYTQRNVINNGYGITYGYKATKRVNPTFVSRLTTSLYNLTDANLTINTNSLEVMYITFYPSASGDVGFTLTGAADSEIY